jgi:hypothetical protein
MAAMMAEKEARGGMPALSWKQRIFTHQRAQEALGTNKNDAGPPYAGEI